jgi:hypothetical protein
LARKTIVVASSAWGADGIGKETAGDTQVENVHGIARTTACRTASTSYNNILYLKWNKAFRFFF